METISRKWIGWAIRLGAAAVVVVLLLLLIIRVDEWRTRRRAERLATEMYGLKVGTSTTADVQALLNRWKPWIERPYSPCTPEECYYEIVVADPLQHMIFRMPWDPYPSDDTMDGLAGVLHAHIGFARLSMTLEHGVLKDSVFWLETDVPKGFGPKCDPKRFDCANYVAYSSAEYGLVASMRQRMELDLIHENNSRTVYPTYAITKPESCMNCIAVEVDYTPEISRQDLAKLLDVNFSCMTQWKTCTVETDIAPRTWKEYLGPQ